MVLLHYPSPLGNTPTADVKGLRDYALVLLGLNTPHRLEDIAALRWSDLQIHDASVTIHWRHAHGLARDERLPSIVSTALLHYLHALHGTALAAVGPDTPLWIGLRRIGDDMMLSTRAIAAIYREYLGKTQSRALQSRFAATSASRIKAEQTAAAPPKNVTKLLPQPSDLDSAAGSSIRATAAAALTAMLQAPIQHLSAIAPSDVATLRDEIVRRKDTESKSAIIRDLWQTTGGKRFLAASQLYTMLLNR